MGDRALRERIAAVVDVTLGHEGAADEWDSLQQIEVVLAVEDEFGVTIAEFEIPNLRSIDDIALHLEGLRATR